MHDKNRKGMRAMTDSFYQPVARLEGEGGSRVRGAVLEILLAATSAAGKSLGINGLSFVLAGTTIWIEELFSIDPEAAKDFLDAIADMNKRNVTSEEKRAAENRRRAAVEQIFKSADLLFSQEGGKA